ncbi:MAG: gamma carbonic anhydrase family protein [Candidatus Latescibacteria bacterium]|nr:gamma carbonic anhydrase family protein [Candidatus Latescibacterota bacterium]
MIEAFQGISPRVGRNVYVAPTASVTGDVTLGDCASVWHGASVRGDVWKIRIGEFTNIQDCCVCHVTTGGPELVVGDRVTVGHGAVLHSCHIEENCLIGMGAVILDGVRVGRGSIVAANSVLLAGSEVPPNSLVAGVPAGVKKKLGEEAERSLIERAGEYHKLAMAYLGKRKFSWPEE